MNTSKDNQDNLFVNIQKYRPRESTNPKENFFTEVLAFILRKDKESLRKFLKLFSLELDIDLTNYEIKIFTQQTDEFTKRIIDIEIRLESQDKTILIIIENKIDSVVNEYVKEEKIEHQLVEYSKILKRKNEQDENDKKVTTYLFLLTRDYEEPDPWIKETIKNNTEHEFKHIYWSEIYRLFNNNKITHKENEKISPKEVIQFLRNQFIALMESEEMEPFDGLNENDLRNFKNTLQQISKLFDEVGKMFIKIVDDKKLRMKPNEFLYSKEDKLIESKILKNGKSLNLNLDYEIDKEKFCFTINSHLSEIGTCKNDIEKMQKNGYHISESEEYFPHKVFDSKDFFHLPAEQQIKELTEFCKIEIEFCKDLNLIYDKRGNVICL